MRRVFSLFVALVLMIGLLPTGAMAAGESVVVIAASDYQLSNSGTIMTNIMKQKPVFLNILFNDSCESGFLFPGQRLSFFVFVS